MIKRVGKPVEKLHIQPGDRYGRLTCLKFSYIGKHSRSHFLFKCDCGKEKVILGAVVVSGNTKSCGCLATEAKKAKRISEHYCEITAIMLGYKRHARSRGLEFMLNRQFVAEIVCKPCYYCGAPPSNFMKTKNSIIGLPFSGIDRVDSKKDYLENNVVPCCKMCNNAKSNYSIDAFKAWVIRISAMADQWG